MARLELTASTTSVAQGTLSGQATLFARLGERHVGAVNTQHTATIYYALEPAQRAVNAFFVANFDSDGQRGLLCFWVDRSDSGALKVRSTAIESKCKMLKNDGKGMGRSQNTGVRSQNAEGLVDMMVSVMLWRFNVRTDRRKFPASYYVTRSSG